MCKKLSVIIPVTKPLLQNQCQRGSLFPPIGAFATREKSPPNFSFDIGSTWVVDTINCHTLRLAPWERNVAKLHVLLLLLLLHNSSLTYLRTFLVYSWSYIKIKKKFRWQGEGMNHPRERERERERELLLWYRYFMTGNQKASLPHLFLSVFEIQAAQISSLLADRSNCRRSGGRSAASSRDLSSSLERLLPLARAHTHTHQHQHSTLSLSLLWALAVVCGWKTWMIIKKELWLQKERPGGGVYPSIHPSIHPSIDGW